MFYNAVAIIKIPALTSRVGRIPWGLLCVDNRGGGLENEICGNYLSELAWRLAVLLEWLDLVASKQADEERGWRQ